jgi:hypothetical protein
MKLIIILVIIKFELYKYTAEALSIYGIKFLEFNLSINLLKQCLLLDCLVIIFLMEASISIIMAIRKIINSFISI